MYNIFGSNDAKWPCKDCPDRHSACWSSCEKYQKAKAEHLKNENRRQKQAAVERDFVKVRNFNKHKHPKKDFIGGDDDV